MQYPCVRIRMHICSLTLRKKKYHTLSVGIVENKKYAYKKTLPGIKFYFVIRPILYDILPKPIL